MHPHSVGCPDAHLNKLLGLAQISTRSDHIPPLDVHVTEHRGGAELVGPIGASVAQESLVVAEHDFLRWQHASWNFHQGGVQFEVPGLQRFSAFLGGLQSLVEDAQALNATIRSESGMLAHGLHQPSLTKSDLWRGFKTKILL